MREVLYRTGIWLAALLFGSMTIAVHHFGWEKVIGAMTSQTAAAWVQAFGSIAAIIGSVYVAEMQHRKHRHDEQQRAVERKAAHLKAAASLCIDPATLIKYWTDLYKNESDFKMDLRDELIFDSQRFLTAEAGLRSIAMHELEDFILAGQILQLANDVHETHVMLRSARDKLIGGDSSWRSGIYGRLLELSVRSESTALRVAELVAKLQ